MFCPHFADNGNCTRYNGMILSSPRQGRLGASKNVDANEKEVFKSAC